MLWRRIVVRNRERVVLVQGGEFSTILLPGVHRIPGASYEAVETEKHHLDNPVFESVWADYLAEQKPEVVERHFACVETNVNQVALVYLNRQLFTVMVPAKRMLFWRDAAAVTAEVVNLFEAPTMLDHAGAFDGLVGRSKHRSSPK